jgi:hypothetical protein
VVFLTSETLNLHRLEHNEKKSRAREKGERVRGKNEKWERRKQEFRKKIH